MSGDSPHLQKLMQRSAAITTGGDDEPFATEEYEPIDSKGYNLARGRRPPGFSIALHGEAGKRGVGDASTQPQRETYWISYHSLRRLKSYEIDGGEFLSFAHENLAVTLSGLRLRALLSMIGEGRVVAVFEPPTSFRAPVESKLPIITGIRVTDLDAPPRPKKDQGSPLQLAKL